LPVAAPTAAPQTPRSRQATAERPGAVTESQEVASLRRYVAQVVLATSLVALGPMAAVWWLRSSGVLTSYVLGMLLGVGLSLGAAHAGRLLWQTRPGSQHLLFGELLIWGFARRCYSERRLASARSVLGSMNQAQQRVANGLSAEDQTRLLETLAKALDACDPNTQGHSRRVARYSWMIATNMGLAREEVARIRTAAAVHDIGKIETPRAVLRKAGPLSDDEFEVMKRHAAAGARMAEVLNDEGLTSMVRHHHERLDGSGYPSALSGEEIPIGARIIAVADTFDSITANRPYRAARTHKEALDILLGEADTKLDPDAVRAFCRHYSGRRPLTLWAWLTTLPERLVSQLGGGVVGVASTAKVLAVAAIVGSLAAGTASLAQPAGQASRRFKPPSAAQGAAVPAAPAPGAALRPVSYTPASASGPQATHPRGRRRPTAAGAPTEGATTSTASQSASTDTSSGRAASSGAPSAAAPARDERGEAVGKSQRSGEAQEEGGSTVAGASPREAGGGETGGKRSEEHQSGGEHGGTGSEGAETPAEASKPASAVEEVKGKVEEVKGKVEEVTGKVEEVKTKAVEEVKSKVGEVKGKLEEVTGKTKEVLGKL
jgi:putative nucleotidyltransferase with HDIG domain